MRALLIIGLIAGLASQTAVADCSSPTAAADVPKGATASREEMVSAMQAMKSYNAAFTAFAECVLKTDGDRARLELAKLRLQKFADKFNAELRAFKALQ